MSTWKERFDAANEQMCVARIEWQEAEKAMARANAKRNCAERVMHQLWQEYTDSLSKPNPNGEQQ